MYLITNDLRTHHNFTFVKNMALKDPQGKIAGVILSKIQIS